MFAVTHNCLSGIFCLFATRYRMESSQSQLEYLAFSKRITRGSEAMTFNQATIEDLDKSDQFFWSIGRFISAFSNLEFDIKCYISLAIKLSEEYFDQVLSHDFAMLCTM